MKKSGTILSSIALASAAVLALSGCGGSTTPASPGDGDDGELTPVTLMLNWYPYGEHAAFYYGVDQGIFEEHGIDLTIKAGQGSTKTAQAVGQGQVDFGWADTPAVLANIDKGVGIKSVGVFLQTTPSAVQVFADSGISSPEDLKGKTIAVSAGDAPTTTFPMYLEECGEDGGYLRYSDAGLNFFSNGLIAPTDTIESDPELVEALVAATSEAFEAAQEDPEAAVAAMEGKDPQMPSQEVLLHQWEGTIELLHTDATEGEAPGANATADWESTLEVLSEAGLISGDGDVDTYFDDAFTPGK